MSEMIRIRSIKEYFNEFGVEMVGKGKPTDFVKAQIVDAFRREIFDQIFWKLKITDMSEAEQTPENERIVENIFRNSYKKWLGLIKLFDKYRETRGMLKPEDLNPFEDEEEADDIQEEETEEDGGLAAGADGEEQDPEESADAPAEKVAEPVSGDILDWWDTTHPAQ